VADPLVGDVLFKSTDGRVILEVSSDSMDKTDSQLTMRSPDGRLVVEIRTGTGFLGVYDPSTEQGIALLGDTGTIILEQAQFVRTGAAGHTIGLDGEHARIWLGADGIPGQVFVRTGAGGDTIELDGEHARIWLGASGIPGHLYLRTGAGKDTLHLDGEQGDIVLLNADCAEDFTVQNPTTSEPGTVMVLGEDGLIKPSEREYDTAVVGVISGAGGLRPGIVLDRGSVDGARFPVALMGKVYCKADAINGPINIGDMLTTSPTVGHAMRSEASEKAFGAVIGKALAKLPKGRDMVPILVGLQ
jgi:hypothetical protein